MSEILQMEANAFDKQILDRIAHGHIPDLRNTRPCEYFYNNIWRHPDYVKMYFGAAFERVLGYIRRFSGNSPRILEAGCGPGYVCLELARHGLDVTGMDISAECIKTAQKIAGAEKFSGNCKAPTYRVEGFMETEGRYDVILFWSTLHHFADCGGVMKKVGRLLNPGGIVIVFEPTRDRVTPKTVTQIYLIEQMLAMTGNFYKKPDVNDSLDQMRDKIKKMYHLQKYETEDGENLQSVNDNESGYEQILPALREHFIQLEYQDGYAFFFQLIGGLRMKDAAENSKMAHFIRMMDALMCEMKVITPTEFYFVGKKVD
jgi:2-polyprenyl-3-methyl-5-hydroxy-6-metoxy-1,4-benzoquinol methylase